MYWTNWWVVFLLGALLGWSIDFILYGCCWWRTHHNGLERPLQQQTECAGADQTRLDLYRRRTANLTGGGGLLSELGRTFTTADDQIFMTALQRVQTALVEGAKAAEEVTRLQLRLTVAETSIAFAIQGCRRAGPQRMAGSQCGKRCAASGELGQWMTKNAKLRSDLTQAQQRRNRMRHRRQQEHPEESHRQDRSSQPLIHATHPGGGETIAETKVTTKEEGPEERVVTTTAEQPQTEDYTIDHNPGEVNDPLIDIDGIGKVYTERLQAAGIYTFAQLAATPPNTLRQIVQARGRKLADLQRWIEQARRMKDDKVTG